MESGLAKSCYCPVGWTFRLHFGVVIQHLMDWDVTKGMRVGLYA